MVAWFIIVRIGLIVIVPSPSARCMSTRNVESPSVFFATWSAGVVRASSTIRSECSAREVQIFWPLTTSSRRRSRVAVVWIAVVSEPASAR